jgi:hypothetical protein
MSTAVEVAPRVTRAKVSRSSGFMVAPMPGPRSAWRMRLPTREGGGLEKGGVTPLNKFNS